MHLSRRVIASALASSAAALFLPSSASEPSEVIEHRTKHRFPLSRTIGDAPASFLGANTRCMLGWCKVAAARAYAFGLYADAPLLTRVAAASSGASSRTTALLDAMEAAAGAREPSQLSLLIIVARDIDGGHMAGGFRRSILALYKKLLAKRGLAASSDTVVADIGAFLSVIEKETFVVGDELVFSWSARDSTLRVFIRGVPASVSIRDPLLSRAFFDVYAGDEPVSARAAKTFESNLSAIAGVKSQDVLQVLQRAALTEHASRVK